MELGMSLPMGEDRSVPLITEVWLLPSLLSILISSGIGISPLILLCIAICSLITAFVSTQELQKICLANRIHSLAELLHADEIQQLEVALLGLLATRVLDILMMAIQSQTSSTPLSSRSLHSATTSSVIVSPPQVPKVGVTKVEEPPLAEASTSRKMPPPTTSTDPKAGSSKYRRIIPTPIPITSSKASRSASKLLSVIVPKLTVPVDALPEWINHPGGHKDYKCQLYAFQHMNKNCMLMHIWQHVDMSVSCPMCGKGFQNVASLHKHGQKVHSIQIVEVEHE